MSTMFDGYHESYNAEVRLVILWALAQEPDYRLNDSLMMSVLQAYAINRGRDFVRNHLQWLATEVQAVRLTAAGSAVIAELTEAGLDHVERRVVLAGVKKPSPVRG